MLDTLNRTTEISTKLRHDLAIGGKSYRDNANPHTVRRSALDGNLGHWWEAAPGQTNGTVTLALPKAVTFDVVSLQEPVIIVANELNPSPSKHGTARPGQPRRKSCHDNLTHRRSFAGYRLKSPVITDQVAHPHHRFRASNHAGRKWASSSNPFKALPAEHYP